ncbi:ATP-dependent DNA helicase [Demequina muriae]|uniref:DNA 3'-5' helicase n=1 Tax=Demequina muriae TaxID=3051664 RepID=A0ABT8GI98_9MICO|nr:ATP-dependent DNA helicase [Demequina sp. EGI L300058]MDN4480981.1 ATP-dependent DNA helicase [Demequina sp. EGI L300058]
MTDDGIVKGQGRRVEALAELIAPGRPPTAEQAAIIGAGTEPMLVVAGAGSGKTETLSMRIVYLLDHAQELFGTDIAPDEILCLTFTRKAAAEIAERADERISRVWDAVETGPDGRERRRRDPERPAPTVATYNAYAAALASEHGLRVGVDPDSTVVTDAALWQLAARALEEWTAALETDAAPGTVRGSLPRLAAQMREHGVSPAAMREWLADTLSFVEGLPKKVGDGIPGTMTATLAGRIGKLRTLLGMTDLVEDFQRRKHEGALLDFSDQVAVAVDLAGLPAVQQIERSRYRAVLLDEFQDTSPAQLRLFGEMFGAEHPVMAVGDPNQAIYGFRGASAAALEDFVTLFGGPECVRQASLSVSWRNEGAILDVANASAEPLREATSVPVERLVSRAALQGRPEPTRDAPGVEAHMAATEEDEATVVVDYLLARREALGHGRPWRGSDGAFVTDGAGRATPRIVEAAVLCRRRATIPLVVDELERRGVDYEVVGLGGLLDTPDVADLVALLEVAHDPSRGDALMRLLTSERVNLGPRDLMALRDRAEVIAGGRAEREGAPSIVDALEDLPPVGWVSYEDRALTSEARSRLERLRRAIRQLREHTYLPLTELIAFAERVWCLDIEAEVARPDGRVRRNVDAFLDAARTFAQGAEHATLGSFLHWLDAARSEERGLDAPVKDPEPGAVQVLTVHSAKGLEWDVVAVPGATDGRFPMFMHFHGKHEDGAWLSGDPEVPWALRMDARSLPDWHVHRAVDHASLGDTITNFRTAAGLHRLDEERRLFYVALTRARSHVLVSGSWYAGGRTVRRPSPFVTELVDAGLLSDADWAPEPEDDAEPPEPPLHVGAWPRPDSPARARRRSLAAAVRRGAPDGVEPAHLPLAAEIAAMLDERERRMSGPPEVPLPAHLSASALVAMRRDRDAFAIQLRRPVPQEPSLAAQRGSALHAWIETQYGHVPLLAPEDLDPDGDVSADVAGLRATFAASEWASRQPSDVEVDVEVPLAGVTIRSRIDAVFPAGGGLDRVTVVDWKSGRPPRDPDERAAREVQLAVYRLAWSEWKGIALDEVDAAFYYVADDVTVKPRALLSREEIIALISGDE